MPATLKKDGFGTQAARHFCQDTESNRMTIGTIQDRPLAGRLLTSCRPPSENEHLHVRKNI
jgi:hypothetical protein